MVCIPSPTQYFQERRLLPETLLIYILDEYHYHVHVFDQQVNSVLFANKVGRGKGEYPMGKILQYSPITMEYKSELNRMGKGLIAMHELRV